MALISCPDCRKQVSDKAVACINCGYPIKELIYTIMPDNVVENSKKSKVFDRSKIPNLRIGTLCRK